MAQGTLPGFISALRAGLRPVALRTILRASRAHPSFPFSYISGFIDSLKCPGAQAPGHSLFSGRSRAVLHPAGNVRLDLLQRNAQGRGQFTVQQPLRLLHVPLVHHAQPPLLGFRLTLL